MKAFLIVGDAYSIFAEAERVMRVSDVLRSLERDEAWLGAAKFVVGQGLADSEIGELRALFSARGLDDAVLFPQPPAPLALTHKRELNNVMISAPERVGERRFAFTMLLTEREDRLSDHVTGRHVSGMLLVEAARQCTLAMLELIYGVEGGRRFGLAWSTLHADFKSFAFPVPLNLVTEVSDETRDARGKLVTLITTEINQAGTVVAQIRLEVGLVEGDALTRVEARKAEQAIGRALQAFADRQVQVA